MIPQEIIDQILDKLDIVEVVSGYIQLKKVGRSFKTVCPFHNEKTPSFIVSPEKQIYHCFGCAAGGNAIGFVMQYENMTFIEAVKLLADKTGVQLPRYEKYKGPEASLTDRLYEINNLAAAFFQNTLRKEEGKKALEYFKKRAIKPNTLAEFRLGYAPDEWEGLRKFCNAKNISDELLRKAGLTVSSEKGKRDYDRFRNRIIFPIFNEKGHIAAFGARVMDDSLPKYINSPETATYSKSNMLYGLNFSKKGIREKGFVVIVEGYLDVIIPFQEGIQNIVAASGTALTPSQVNLLKKYTDTAIIVFDADQAGQAASLRGLDILIANDMKVRLVSLPKGEDPDSFVRKNGKDAFEKFLNTAKDLFDYKLDLLIAKLGVQDIAGITEEMLPTLRKVQNAAVQSGYLRRLAERLGVHEASLRHEIGKVKPDYSYQKEASVVVNKKAPSYRNSELHILGLAISDRKAFDKVRSELGWEKLHDENVIKAMKLVGDFFEKSDSELIPGKLLSNLEKDDPVKSVIIQAVSKADITSDPAKALQDCIFHILKSNRNEVIKELTRKLKAAETANDDNEVRNILVKINKLHKEKVV